jgi:hypothetical protein
VDLDRLDQVITSGQVMKRGSTSRALKTVGRLGKGCWAVLAFFIGSSSGVEGVAIRVVEAARARASG